MPKQVAYVSWWAVPKHNPFLLQVMQFISEWSGNIIKKREL
jgi:hypothetical protein